MLPFPIINKTNIIPKGDIKKIVMGSTSMTILGTDGTMTSYGTNTNGYMGTGSTSSSVGWYETTTLSDVRDVFQNSSVCAIAVKNDGSIWFCGTYRNNQLGAPNLSTASPITSYVDISDRIPVSGSVITKVVFTYSYVSILCSDGTIYSTDAGLGGTTITSTGYTGWRVSTPSVHLIDFDTYSGASSYSSVYLGLDASGYAYSIGYNGWKQIDGTTTSQYYVWTPTIPSKTFKSISADISNAFVLLSTDNIVYYSGISGVVNTAGASNSLNGYAVYNGSSSAPVNPIYILTSVSGCYHIRRNGSMWGSYSNNQVPMTTTNTGNVSLNVIRNLPNVNTESIEYCMSTSPSRSMFVYYGGASGTRKLYCLGQITGSSSTLFTEVQLPTKYT